MTEEEHLSAIKDATIHYLIAAEKQQTWTFNMPKQRVNPYDDMRDARYAFLSKCMVEAKEAGYGDSAMRTHKNVRDQFYADNRHIDAEQMVLADIAKRI